MAFEIGIPLLLAGIIFVMGFLAVRIDKKHGAIQLLLLFICLFSIILGLAVVIEIANIQSLTSIAGMLTSLYMLFIYATIFILCYFILMMVWNAFTDRKERKLQEEEY